MEKKLFKTLVKGNHEKFGGNRYVVGKISGINHVLCGNSNRFAHTFDDKTGDTLIKHECYQEQYDIFRITIEELYPGLCEFDYKSL